jgi:CheY-like chemotaxis protein
MDTSILENKRILLVEDDPVNQMLFQRSINKITTNIAIADNGDKALDILSRETFDLIIMDIYLEGIDGCEVTVKIRTDLKLDTPIIAVTASPIEDELKRCIKSGMNSYLRKPFTVNQLSEEAAKFLPATQIENPRSVMGDGTVTVDLNFLLEIAENDIPYIQLMIKTFLENMPPVIKKMRQFNIDGDKDNLAKTAHFAKSSLSVIQIQQMLEQARLIETDARSKNFSDEKMLGAIVKFDDQFTHARNILNNYIISISA